MWQPALKEQRYNSNFIKIFRWKGLFLLNLIKYFNEQRLPVPWRSIVTSAPVWAIVITHTCSVFGFATIVTQLPTYMKYILNFNIKEVGILDKILIKSTERSIREWNWISQNGLLSSLPYFGKYIFALLLSTLADYLRRTDKLSVTAIRKIFTTFGKWLFTDFIPHFRNFLHSCPSNNSSIFSYNY